MLKNRLSSMAHAVAVLFAITVVLAMGQHAHAQTKTWTGGGGDTSWHNPDNWSPVGVPGASDDVLIATGDPKATIVIASPTVSIGSLESDTTLDVSTTLAVSNAATVNADVLISSGILQGGTWTVTNGAVRPNTSFNNRWIGGVLLTGDILLDTANAWLRVSNGLSVNGTVHLSGAGARIVADGNQTWSTGTFLFDSVEPTLPNIQLGHAGPSTLTLGSDILIKGGNGSIRHPNQSASMLINNGTIEADQPGRDIRFQVNWTNNGTARAIDGGELRLSSNWTNAGHVEGITGTVVLASGTLNNAASPQTLNATTGSWVLDGGWIQGGVLTIEEPAKLVITGSNNNRLAGGVTVNGDILLDTANARLGIANGLSVNGTVYLTASGATIRSVGNQTWSSGTFVFDPPSGTARIGVADSFTTQTLTLGPDVLVHGGAGLINTWGNGSTLINNGTIEADQAGRNIQISNQTFTNNGTARAMDGGELRLGSSSWTNAGHVEGITGTVVLSGGTLNNAATPQTLNISTGSWVLDGGTIQGGVLTIEEPAKLVITGSNSNRLAGGVTVNGDILLDTANARLGISNGLSVNGTVYLIASGATIRSIGNQTWSSGTFVFDPPTGTARIGVADSFSTQSLTLGPDVLVHGGAGLIYTWGNGSTLINNGVIEANQAGQNIQISNQTFTNNGTLTAKDAATLSIGGSTGFTNLQSSILTGGTYIVEADSTMNFANAVIHTNNASIILDGADSSFNAVDDFEVNEGVFTVIGDRTFTVANELHNHGELRGDGTLVGNIINHATFIPGSEAAPMIVTGFLELTEDGEMVIDADRTSSPGDWSPRLDVVGELTIAGQLTPNLPEGFFDVPGTEITVINAESYSGQFDEVTVCVGYQVLYDESSVGLLLLELPVLGDLNCDGVVNVSDLLVLLSQWGLCPRSGDCPADLNGDGAVNVSDLLILLSNWG
jgi:hypothetical protein